MIEIENLEIKKRKVKHARINVHPDFRVKVIVPMHYTKSEINSLLNKKANWIKKQLDYFKLLKRTKIELEEDEILYLGEKYKFRHDPKMNGKEEINSNDKTIITGENLLQNGTLEKWYRAEIRSIIKDRLKHYSSKHNFQYNKVYIRKQKTRWGSCSGKKNLSFNLKLIQTPHFVIDYLIVHELVHTKILNHSNAFWLNVESVYPNYEEAANWLKNFNPY